MILPNIIQHIVQKLTLGKNEDTLLASGRDGTVELTSSGSVQLDLVVGFNKLEASNSVSENDGSNVIPHLLYRRTRDTSTSVVWVGGDTLLYMGERGKDVSNVVAQTPEERVKSLPTFIMSTHDG